VLTAKTIAACREHDVSTLIIGGGFSANSQLREMAAERCAAAGIDLRIPPIRYCTDNGAMIAALGSAVVRAGLPPSDLDIGVDSSMPLSIITV
jgi:N6-L-threonylcarbamoyladenine synthase